MLGDGVEILIIETGRLFFRRHAKQLPLQRNIFELSPHDLSLMPQMQAYVIAFLHIPEN